MDLQEILKDSFTDLKEAVFKAHDVIFKDGDESREMYFIIDGKVKISKQMRNGSSKVLAILSKGDIFGEGALLSGDSRSASAESVTDVKVLVLKAEDFKKLQAEKSDAAVKLLMKIVQIVNNRLQYVNMELLTLYEVARILSSAPDDLGMTFSEILKKFSEVTDCEEAMIFLHNASTEKEDMLVVSEGSGSGFVSEAASNASEIAKFFRENAGERYKNEDGKLLWIPIRDFAGKYFGLTVLKNSEGSFDKNEIKLALSIADQLSTAVERHYRSEDDKEKVMLKQETVDF
ncbi:MAG: cyclic nucleotide-binding domain-containing protein [Patescibacteria group bacterium]|nr:cyclic nucleotide-binding domain-containing protein [Patescibacteria group bacterium]